MAVRIEASFPDQSTFWGPALSRGSVCRTNVQSRGVLGALCRHVMHSVKDTPLTPSFFFSRTLLP